MDEEALRIVELVDADEYLAGLFEAAEAVDDDEARKHAWSETYLLYREAMHRCARSVLSVPVAQDELRVVGGETAADVVGNALRGMMVKGFPQGRRDVKRYVLTCVKRRATDVVRSASGYKKVVDLGKDEIDDRPGIDRVLRREAVLQEVERNLHVLTERERYVITERVMRARPLKEVASELGVSDSYVSQLAKLALARLRPFVISATDRVEARQFSERGML